MTRPRFSPNRDLQDLCVEAQAAGWRVDKTNGDHLKLTAPSGAFVFASQTPSDWRAVHHVRATLDRSWPGWDGRARAKAAPRERAKRPGRSPERRGADRWDGRKGTEETPIGATMADLWPGRRP